jgi:hypothetical protein
VLICLGVAYVVSFLVVFVVTKGPPWWENEYLNMIGAAGVGAFATAAGLGANWLLFARKKST